MLRVYVTHNLNKSNNKKSPWQQVEKMSECMCTHNLNNST